MFVQNHTILCLFRQTFRGRQSTKLTTMVDFPVEGFDMSSHLAHKKNSMNLGDSHTPVILGGIGWSPWKRQRKHSHPADSVYDLYGVCYHHGTDLETGHYTAACKNPYNNQWYLYDDTKITNLSLQANNINAELVNNSAYMLFYQRRNGVYVSSGSNSSSAASTSSVGSSNEHWVCRMPKFCYKATKTDATNEQDEQSNNRNGTNNCETSETPKLDVVDAKNCKNSQESLALRTSQVTLQINNGEEPPKKPLYTTSIYINSSGNVDITTNLASDERTRWFNGNRGYDTLSSINRCPRDVIECDKRYHSDDEAPPVRMEWVSNNNLLPTQTFL